MKKREGKGGIKKKNIPHMSGSPLSFQKEALL